MRGGLYGKRMSGAAHRSGSTAVNGESGGVDPDQEDGVFPLDRGDRLLTARRTRATHQLTAALADIPLDGLIGVSCLDGHPPRCDVISRAMRVLVRQLPRFDRVLQT